MIPGVNPKQLHQAMKRMGMEQEEIEAEEVIIKTKEKNIIIKKPSVAKITMMGEESFQISGKIIEEAISSEQNISREDVEVVAEQAGCTPEEAENAIRKSNGDLTLAILELQKKTQEK